jgi:hypothetical protein
MFGFGSWNTSTENRKYSDTATPIESLIYGGNRIVAFESKDKICVSHVDAIGKPWYVMR